MAQGQMQVDFTQAVNEIANRIRVLESRQTLFSEKLLVINQNMIEEYKKVMGEVKGLRQKNVVLEKDLAEMKKVMRHFSEEAGKFAQRTEIKVLEKYIKLWDPLHFTTEEDVQRMIDEAHHRRKKKEVEHHG